MNDMTTIRKSETPATIRDSKLYRLSQLEPILPFLVPDMPTQMSTEIEIDEKFPREESDGDTTRIIINFRNLKGRSQAYKVNDALRLDNTFDIDNFMAGYHQQLEIPSTQTESQQVATAILSALNMCVTAKLGMDPALKKPKTEALVHQVLTSLTAIICNDALDVLISMNEIPAKDGATETGTIIAGMWGVKFRKNEPVAVNDTTD